MRTFIAIVAIVAIVLLSIAVVDAMSKRIPMAKKRNLWLSAKNYYSYLNHNTVKNHYGGSDILPVIINGDEGLVSIIRIYTECDLHKTLRPLIVANFHLRKVTKTVYSTRVITPKIDGSQAFNCQVSIRPIRILHRRVVLVSAMGRDFLLDRNETIRTFICDIKATAAVRAYDIENHRQVYVRFYEPRTGYIEMRVDAIVDKVPTAI